jgi:hypothetical protein
MVGGSACKGAQALRDTDQPIARRRLAAALRVRLAAALSPARATSASALPSRCRATDTHRARLPSGRASRSANSADEARRPTACRRVSRCAASSTQTVVRTQAHHRPREALPNLADVHAAVVRRLDVQVLIERAAKRNLARQHQQRRRLDGGVQRQLALVIGTMPARSKRRAASCSSLVMSAPSADTLPATGHRPSDPRHPTQDNRATGAARLPPHQPGAREPSKTPLPPIGSSVC